MIEGSALLLIAWILGAKLWLMGLGAAFFFIIDPDHNADRAMAGGAIVGMLAVFLEGTKR